MAARGLLGLSQTELAEAVGIALQTIYRFEKGLRVPSGVTLDRIRGELERRGIEFTNGTGLGVRLSFEKAAAYAKTAGATRSTADH